jgi:putative MATE family efflux protein
VSLIVLAAALVFRRPIIRLLYGRLEDEVMSAAALYFLITALSYPFLAVYNADAALFRALGNSRIPMLIALMVNIMNIGGNAFFIFILHIGVAGAALSTLISRSAAAVIMTFLLTANRRGPLVISGLFKIQLNRRMIHTILNVGIPGGLESSMFQIGRLLTQRIFPVFGTAAMAGNAIASVINSFSFMPGMAFGMAMLTIVGQCVGARDYGAAKKETAKLMKLAYVTLFIIGALIYIFMDPLIQLFSLSPGAREMAKSFLRIHCISMAIGWPMSFALPNALRAAGDARYVMIVATASMWLVRVSAAYILTYAFGIGPLAVWLAMGLDFICRGSFYLARWLGGRWEKMKVIED